jgi:hypothetical protein
VLDLLCGDDLVKQAADRAQAAHLLLRAFALEDAVDATAEDTKIATRVLGIAPNGRRQRVDQHLEIVMLLAPYVIDMLRAGWQDNLQGNHRCPRSHA